MTPIFPPARGGASNYFSILTGRLSQSPEVEKIAVVTQFVPGSSVTNRIAGGKVYRLLLPRHAIGSPNPIYNGVAAVLNVLITVLLLAWARVFSGYSIVHCHSGELFLHGKRNPILLVAMRMLRYRVVCDVRDLYSVPDDRFFGHAIITASLAITEKVVVHSKLDPMLIPVPLELPDESYLQDGLSSAVTRPTGPYLVYVGNVADSKGIADLVRAWKHSKNLHDEYELVVAGPSYRASYELMRLLESDDRIHLTGPVSHQTALGLIKHAAVLVAPSPNEGLPRVCLEAMALGTPAVCHQSVRELSECYPQLTYASTDPITLKTPIIHATKLGPPNRFDITRYSAENVADNYLPVYRSVARS